MKKIIISVISILAAASVMYISACGAEVKAKAELIGSPAHTTSLPYSERTGKDFLDIKAGANEFAYDFSEQTYSLLGGSDNFAVAPVSVYMALSVAAECAAGQTRDEIVSALGMPYETLKNNFSKLYRSLIFEDSRYDRLTGKLSLTNSIWLNSGMSELLNVKDECIKSLSDKFFCYSYSADFTNSNKQANQALKDFIKEQTNDLINNDFEISQNVSFILLNTLYLKDLWNLNSDDLRLTDDSYEFTPSSGSVKSTKLLQSYYSVGRTYEDETFTHYYAQTSHGYKIKFILPKDGYTVTDVFTAENIETVNTLTDYDALDEQNLIRYNTRCLFPEFSASFDGDVKKVLKSHFKINSMFDETSDFSTISDMKNTCSAVLHTTSLTVNRKGIEGAAVTRLDFAGSPGPDEYTDVYNDFVIDRAFGYVISNSNDTIVFTGVVNGI